MTVLFEIVYVYLIDDLSLSNDQLNIVVLSYDMRQLKYIYIYIFINSSSIRKSALCIKCRAAY